MATKLSGPAPFCARESTSCHDCPKGEQCQACQLGQPWNCAFPYRPGKTQGIRMQGKRSTFQVKVPVSR